jgi:hypothetical protein
MSKNGEHLACDLSLSVLTRFELMTRFTSFPRTIMPQSAKTGERDEYEPDRQIGRAPARRSASGDDGRSLRDQDAAAGAHQVGGVLPVGSVGSEERHGRHQARAGHRAASQGGDRRVEGARGPVRGALATQEVAAARAGWCYRFTYLL